MNALKLTVLRDATVELFQHGSVTEEPAFDIAVLPAGTDFRIRAHSPVTGYVYVVELDRADDGLVVLFPQPGEGPDHVRIGASLVLPGVDAFLQAPVDGELRVVVADRPVQDAEWPKLRGGIRDGNGQTTKGTDAGVTAGQIGTTPTPPPQTKTTAPPPKH